MKRIIFSCLSLALATFPGLTTNLHADNPPPTNSTDAILQHPGFREGLVWIGKEPTEKENTSLLQMLDDFGKPYWRTELDKFLEDHPDSPWAASLHFNYAELCHQTGRTSRALQHWEAAWNLVKDDNSPNAQRLGGEILSHWTEQLSSLGRRDKLRELIAVGDKWPFGNRLDREKFQSAKRNYLLMGRHPEMSYRCGTLALKAVGQTLQPTNTALQSLVEISSPVDGFSMSGLAEIAKQYGLDLVAVRRTQGDDLIVPSVIHWRQNHYAAILQQDGENFLINDPTFGKAHWMQRDAINEEASGFFFIPTSKQSSRWQTVGPVELAAIHGKGLYNSINDAQDKGCLPGKKCPPCMGMPVWWVSEPYNNLWIADEPLSYLTSTGEKFTFRINYKQRGLGPNQPYMPPGISTNANFNPWSHSWLSYIFLESPTVNSAFPVFTNSYITLGLPNGGEVDFTPGQTYDPETRIQLQQTDSTRSLGNEWGYTLSGHTPSSTPDNGDNGIRMTHPDGSQDIYGYGLGYSVPGSYYPATVTYMISRHIDPAGRTTTYIYGGPYSQPVYVVDYDGRTNTLTYTPNTSGIGGYVLTSVSNAYGLSAQFKYDANQNLTNIIDAQGLSSYINYDTNYFPTNLITPYGTNTFALYDNPNAASTNGGDGNFGTDSPPYVDRAEVVTDTIGGTHLYLYQFDCANFMGSNYSSGDVPTNTPLGTLDSGTGNTNFLSGVNYRNSFSWNARQYTALSTTNFLGLSTNDYLRGRMKHWLQDTNNLYLSEYLSVERDPSPDGTTEGLKTFYDYQGKLNNYQTGTNPVPSVTAWCPPGGGETHYVYLLYDYFGNVTNEISTYTTTAGTWGTRTNQFFYANNVYTNLVYNGPYEDSNGVYDIYLPEATNTFTVPNLLTRVVAANGSNIWTCGPFDVVVWTNFFQDVGAGESNEIILSSQRVMPDFITNALNQTTAFTFTNFNLITGIQWPSGLTTTNIYYTNGFLAQTIDLQINRTNGFAYSSNGLPSTFTNELGLVINFSWDNLLRPTGATFPDATTISNVYYRLDRSASKDRLGNWTYYGYDGLRHLTARTNANNAVTSYGWCDCGALTSITDALTNTITRNYDYEERLIGVSFPDGSSVAFQYDLAGRRTNTADGSGSAVNLTYNNQSSITNASNAFGSIAQVILDILDRHASITDANNVTATNTFDMLDRLVSRVWTADDIGEGFLYATNGLIGYTNRDGQVTHFVRDSAERLTAITNANMPPSVTQFAYDPASDLITLVDGLSHTNTWNYNPFGWMTNKVDASNHQAVAYSYNANGWPTNRWMPASGNTQYKFDAVGNLTNIVYSNTPTGPVTYIYDADNRLATMIDAIGTTTWTYTSNGQVASETGPWTSNTVSYTYNQGYRTSFTVLQPTGDAWTQTYSYDSAWRLTGLSSPAGTFGYSYPASASRLVQSISLPNATYITNQYDSLARLTNTSLVNYWGHVLDGYGYAYDPLGLRTNISRYLGLTTNDISAGYDNIAQLTSWSAQEFGGAPRLNEQQSYGYDAANNLNARTNGALAQTFSVDALNQLSTVARTGNLTFSGATPAPMSNVTVNGLTAQTNGDFTFARTNVALTNGNNTFTTIATNLYGVSATNILTVNLPSTVTFQNDGNNNLTSDGTRNFVYDAENQLTNVYVTNLWQTQFIYDGLRRRRIEKDFAWQSGWVQTNEIHYVYDGMLVIQERASNNAVQVTYTRGLDLSGSLQRAGGIGGLLARTDTNGSTFYHADGNGNVTALIDGNQNIVARYEWDGFGRPLGMWGTIAPVNRMRFSSFLTISGIILSPTRPYFPELQRWGSQDPIGLAGGINPYPFVGNSPPNFVDPFGLKIGDWYNPLTYIAPSLAWNEGQQQLDQYAQSLGRGYTSYDDALAKLNAEHDPYGLNDDVNYQKQAQQAVQITAGNASDLTQAEQNFYLAVLPGGIAGKEGQEAAQAAKAAEAAKDCEKVTQALPNVKKAVNSNLPHAVQQAVERGVFPDATKAADALRDLSAAITKDGLPPGTLQDTAYADRVLVPVGNNGMAVYQVGQNGTAKLKTVLIAQ